MLVVVLTNLADISHDRSQVSDPFCSSRSVLGKSRSRIRNMSVFP